MGDMICSRCHRFGIFWIGLGTGCPHTYCPHCQGINCQEIDTLEEENGYDE